MTSVVTWVRYDGTEETLPEEGKPVLVLYPENKSMRMATNSEGLTWVDFPDCLGSGSATIEDGDLWSYLPMPREADA